MAPVWFGPGFALPDPLPAPDPDAATPAPFDDDATWCCFAEAAASRLTDLLIVGWSPGAVPVWLSEPSLRGRRTVWAAGPADMPQLVAGLAAIDGAGLDLRLATLRDESALPDLIARLPYAWALVCLGSLEQRSMIREIHRLMLVRTLARADRFRLDLVHLFRRHARRPASLALTSLHGAARGRAALCLAAGPGLDGGLELVRRWQDRAVVIAADVIAGRVCEAGIRVDFVINLDSHERLIASLDRARDACLVMPLNGGASFDVGRERSVFVCDDGLTDVLAPGIGGYVHGTNVGSGTVGFALHLGCEQLVLFGHDLSFGSGAYYAAGIEGGIEAVSRSAADAAQVRSVEGNAGPVTTNMQFGMGIQDLGVMLQTRPHLRAMNHNINLGRGAKIPGTIGVPEGWEPPGEPWPEPPFRDRQPIAWPIDELAQRIPAALAAFRALWLQRRAEGVDLIDRWEMVGNSADQGLLLGRALTDRVLAGWVLDAIRLRSKGASAAIEAGVRELEAIAEQGLWRWVDLISADMRELPEDLPSYVFPPADPWLIAFSAELAGELTPFQRGSVDEVLARYLGRDRGSCRRPAASTCRRSPPGNVRSSRRARPTSAWLRRPRRSWAGICASPAPTPGYARPPSPGPWAARRGGRPCSRRCGTRSSSSMTSCAPGSWTGCPRRWRRWIWWKGSAAAAGRAPPWPAPAACCRWRPTRRRTRSWRRSPRSIPGRSRPWPCAWPPRRPPGWPGVSMRSWAPSPGTT